MPFVHSRCEPNAVGILYVAGKIQIDDRHGQYRAIDVPSAITTENTRKTHLEYCKKCLENPKVFHIFSKPENTWSRVRTKLRNTSQHKDRRNTKQLFHSRGVKRLFAVTFCLYWVQVIIQLPILWPLMILFPDKIYVELTSCLHLGPKLSMRRIMSPVAQYVSLDLQVKSNKRFLISNRYRVVD